MDDERPGPRRPLHLIAAMGIAMTLVITAGAWFYRDQEHQARMAAEQQLTAIGQLKAGQIAAWRRERLGDGKVLSADTSYGEGVARWLKTGAPGDEAAILRLFRGMQENYGYNNLVLLDATGMPRLSLAPADGDMVRELAPLIQRGMLSGQAAMSDLLFMGPPGVPCVCVVAPIRPWLNGRPGEAVGAVLLVSQADQFLYPLVQSWPLPAAMAETLLVRRDGSDVLFLNDLRHRPNAALSLRIPLTNTDTPAVQAALGTTGAFAGVDYRGVAVFAYLAPVPDSPWFIVAKEDEAEVLAAWRIRSVFIGAVVLALVAFCGVAGAGVWQRAQSQQYRAAYAAQVERQALLRHFEYLVKYANDIILLADGQGRLVEVNDRAVAAYGYTRQELLALSPADLDSPGANPSPEADRPEGAVYESLHRRKDGATLPVEISLRDIQVEGQRYRQAIVRDITERKAAEHALRDSQAWLTATLRSIGDAVLTTDADARVTSLNAVAEGLTGWTTAEAGGRPVEEVFRIINAQTRLPVAGPVERVLRDGSIVGLANHTVLISRSGQERQIADSGAPIRPADDHTLGVVLVFRDVTEQHRAQEDLRLSESRFRSIVEHVNDAFFIHDLRGRIVDCNANAAAMLGCRTEDLIGASLANFVSTQEGTLLSDRMAQGMADLVRLGAIAFDSAFARADATAVHVNISARLISQEGDGLVQSFARDMSDHLRAQEQVAASLREKEILLREIHHRVKNNLQVISSMLNLQIQTSDNPSIVDPLRDSQNRIKAMSLIHAKLYQSPDLARVEFGSFVRELGGTLLRSYGANTGRLRLQVAADEVSLDLDTVMPCSLIVNELLANSVRHAFPDGRPGNIIVSVTVHAGRCRLSVADDGVGFPPGIDYRQSPSLGLRLVSMLTEQLDGALSMESAGGTRFTVDFGLRANGQPQAANP